MENLLNGNLVNAYFGICIVEVVISLIATVAIIVIKPLRKWYFSKAYQWGKTLGEEMYSIIKDDVEELIEDLMDIHPSDKEEYEDENN